MDRGRVCMGNPYELELERIVDSVSSVNSSRSSVSSSILSIIPDVDQSRGLCECVVDFRISRERV